MMQKDFLSAIPNDSKVFIYGAGATGKAALNLLTNFRPDVDVKGFIDSFKDGSFLSKPVFGIQSFVSKRPPHDLVVIASVDIETINAMKENISKVASPFIVTGEFATAAFDIYELKKLKQIRDSLEFGTDIFDLVVAARQSNDFQAVNDYFKESIIEKRIQYLAGPELNSCDVIIDGGTFGGQEAMLFAKKAPKGKVYTFDPWGGEQISDRVNFDLQRNLEIVQKALWNKSANLYFNANPIGMHAAGAFVSETQDGDLPCIKGISIDDFVKEKKLPEINFIKMDIEGSEVEAIKGASETISKFKPKLAICVYHRPEHFYEIADLVLEFNPTYKMGFGHYSPHLDESVMYFY